MNVEDSDYYTSVLTPYNAPLDSKTGVTFKGKDAEYIKAHKLMMEMIKSRGDRYLINETEFNIVDTPKNKPACIEVKHKTGQSGKVNFKIYPINGRGGATIHITKISKGDFEHVKVLAFKVVKFLLDNIISGNIDSEDIERMKKKSVSIKDKKSVDTGGVGEEFSGKQESLKKHQENHVEGEKIECEKCDEKIWKPEELKYHSRSVHDDLSSQNSKRMILKSNQGTMMRRCTI